MDVVPVNWDNVTNELIKVVILAFLVERALAVFFDMERLDKHLQDDVKPWVAIVVSVALCYTLKIDAIGTLAAKGTILTDQFKWLGYVLTGLVVAGGAAGAVKLFQDVLGFRRSTREQQKIVEEQQRAASVLEAKAREEKAQAQIASARADMAASTARLTLTAATGNSPEEKVLAARIADRDLKIARGV